MEWSQGAYRFRDGLEHVDVDAVYAMLSTTYWAGHRPRSQMEKSLRGAICFSLWHEEAGERNQVGFLRAVTDQATFTWVCDVIVQPEHRGKGLGKWMMSCMLEHPDLQGTNMCLATRDAHGLYEQYGFVRSELMRRQWAAQQQS